MGDAYSMSRFTHHMVQAMVLALLTLLEVSWYIDERIPIELVEVVWLHSSSSRL